MFAEGAAAGADPFRDFIVALGDAVFTEARLYAERTEELLRLDNGRVDALFLGAIRDAPDSCRVLQDLLRLSPALVPKQGGKDHGQRLRMIQPVQGRQLMADSVGCPVLRHAARDQAVERLRCRPHDVGPGRVVVGLRHDFRAFLHERQQDPFGLPVLKRGVDRVGHVLFHHMDEGIDHPVGGLTRRQRERGLGIQDREPRIDLLAVKGQLLAGRLAGDHRVAVGLGTRGGKREDAAQRHGIFDLRAFGEDVPRLAARKTHGGRDELCAVQHRAAADRQQKTDVFAAPQFHGLHQRFVPGIGLNSPEFLHVKPLERRLGLLVDPVALDRAAAVGHQNRPVFRHQPGHLRDRAFSKDDSRGIEVFEILHGFTSEWLVLRARLRRTGSLRLPYPNTSEGGICSRGKKQTAPDVWRRPHG